MERDFESWTPLAIGRQDDRSLRDVAKKRTPPNGQYVVTRRLRVLRARAR